MKKFKKNRNLSKHSTKLIRNFPDPFFIWKRKGKKFFLAGYNQAAYHFTEGQISKRKEILASSVYKNQPEIIEGLEYCFKRKQKNSKEIKWESENSEHSGYFRVTYAYHAPKYVIVYLHDISKIKRKSKELNLKLMIEQLLSEISSKFVELENFDNKIDFALQKIGKFVDASRAYLFQFDEQKKIFKNTHEWCAEEIKPQISELQSLSMEDYSWTMEKIHRGEVINVSDINQLPSEASSEKKIFLRQDISAILYLPIYEGDKAVGFIGFDYNPSSRKWEKKVLNLLKITADIVGSAIKQHKMDMELRESKQKLKDLNLELEKKIEQRTEELRKSEKKFRNLADQSLMGIAILQDNRVQYVNNALANILGYDTKVLKNWTIEDILDNTIAEDRKFVKEQAIKKQSNDPNVVTHYFTRAYNQEGEKIWLEIYSKPIRYEHKVADLISILDKTAEKKAQQKLKESERDKSIILRSISELIAFQDLDHEIIWTNKAAAESVEYTPEDLKGKKCHQIWNASSDPCENCPVERAINTEKPCLDEKKTSDGRFWEIKGYPVKNEKGGIIGAVEITKDITKLKKIQKDYQQSYYHTQLYKDLFAHDINNLLQNVNASAELIKECLAPLEERTEISNFLEIIKEQVIKGKKLVSNIRKLTEINKKKEARLEKLVINDLLTNAINYIKNSYKSKEIRIKKILSNENLNVKANNMLQDVFENILINAVRHNENTTVKITVKAKKVTRDDKSYVRIEIMDNGIGIPHEVKEKIFQGKKFEQNSETGMGLGLSLVKKIIEQLNGDIWVENRVKDDFSKGSNFIISIPEY
ncbi:MAG: ATP-binding protein [Promethearchaeia archaeon]